MIYQIVQKEMIKQIQSIYQNNIYEIKCDILRDNQLGAHMNWNYSCNNGLYIIKTGDVYDVFSTLKPMWCSCGVPTDQLRPCIHICFILKKQSLKPSSFIPNYYLRSSFLLFHSTPIALPQLSLVKCDEHERIAFQKRVKKGERRKKSTFKDSSCLLKWKKFVSTSNDIECGDIV